MRALAILALLLVVACSSAPMQTFQPTPPTHSPTPQPTLRPTPSPSPTARATPATPRPSPRVAFSDGTHVVGTDVEPGTYRTVAYGRDCYWTRLSGFESGLADWISSGIGPGYHVVTIAPDDAGFESDRCGDWTADLAPVSASPADPIGDGTYIVGTDMAPGIWRATSGTNCYWARLSGFGGTDDEVIAQGLTSEGLAPVVTITATDAGFTSNGCGAWRQTTP